MTVNKKRRQVHEELAQKKKKVRSTGSHTVIKTEKRIQAVTEAEDDDWFETKTKVRRQALQEEIDRESGKTNFFSPKENMDTKIGQWSTAAFQSSERGMKFLRLMGSFKKGSAPREDPSVTTNKSNMALNREGEEKLHQALKMEFDKAMDLKQHRRIGLGFQPAANKKVYIDKYASRSIKFED
uniref:Small acidic protein-like domain-containing protein n=1 Tax=Gallus gallus TaxID=9031 RepID=A0A8V0Z2L1_CHICK